MLAALFRSRIRAAPATAVVAVPQSAVRLCFCAQEYWRFASINMTALTSENLCLELEKGLFPVEQQRPHGYQDYQSIPSHPRPPPVAEAGVTRRRLQQEEGQGEKGSRDEPQRGGGGAEVTGEAYPVGKSPPVLRRHLLAAEAA